MQQHLQRDAVACERNITIPIPPHIGDRPAGRELCSIEGRPAQHADR